MSQICVSNISNRKEIEVGKTYEVFNHENGPKFAWVKIIDKSNSIGWRTIQCYSSDFKSISEFRNDKINDILS
jgi:hypothetical protein